ncbi:MAG: hypothetical protein DCC65_16455 [Planctomycetota bacterium]|nr:MAG: hypothetical protein DCC65_16455 [Planctomycetota bacterium]
MSRIINTRRAVVWVLLALSAVGVTTGLNCPGTGGDPNNPPVPAGNRPPWITITSIVTDFGNNFAEVGDPVTINFTGEDGEDAAVARIFASTSGNPTPQQEIPILGGFPVGPGVANGSAVWDTTSIPAGTYNVFAEIDDRTYDPLSGQGNLPVRVVSSAPVQIGPPGTEPSTSPPQVVFLAPTVNIGLSALDELTLRYIYADVDSSATITLLLDKDLIPNNDDINNPGDPFDPATNIIILPSANRQDDDPTFDGDPPPPGTPEDPIEQPDSLEVRRNPRILPPTTPGQLPFPGAPLAGEEKTYIFQIDFARIPPRELPYFIRATITDGNDTRHIYSSGALNIAGAASGIVNVADLGFKYSGARFVGFSAGENLGTDFVAATDIDLDGAQDFMIASRFGSPRNRPQVGAAYLVFGRPKLPFPADTDGDGLPDGGVTGPDGEIVDFPEPPEYLANPYDASNVGRFGGSISINSIGSFFRGTIYAMPTPFGMTGPPGDLADPLHPSALSAGLTSITRADLTADGVADLIFGLPWVSAYDHADDDPADQCSEMGGPYSAEGDVFPNADNCSVVPNDDLGPVDQGIVILVDGTNDLRNVFRRFVDARIAGQFDEAGAVDDEFISHSDLDTPRGLRWRGGWFNGDPLALGIDSFNQFGRTVSAIQSLDNDPGEELLISSPGFPFGIGPGRVQIWYSDFRQNGYLNETFRGPDEIYSFPNYAGNCPPPFSGNCTETDPPNCVRCFQGVPQNSQIIGTTDGDMFGFATSAGQANQDGAPDIACGAPAADPNGMADAGIFYILFSPSGGFGNVVVEDVPHLKVMGVNAGDRFGAVQAGIEDVNGDAVSDVAFASEFFDADINGDLFPETDVGYVGVLFGRQPWTGELGFTADQVGTPQLVGVRFLGAMAGAAAGRDVASAGDFNGDGSGDLLISSPGEIRCRRTDGTFELPTNGVCAAGRVPHLGVGYLIFGGPHLDPTVNGRTNNVFVLSEVGSTALPGIVFVGRVLQGVGSETEAPIDFVGGVGDVDGDGFDDIMLGAPRADFVNQADPTQRRPDAGEAYLIYGNSFGSNQVP